MTLDILLWIILAGVVEKTIPHSIPSFKTIVNIFSRIKNVGEKVRAMDLRKI